MADQVVGDGEERSRSCRSTIDSSDGATFPYAWYFRDLDVGYLDLSTAAAPPASDVLVMTEASSQRLAPQLAAYEGRRFPFRVWWVRDYSKATPGAGCAGSPSARPGTPPAGMPEYLYVRRELTG